MQDDDDTTAAMVRGALEPLVAAPRGVRTISERSRLSQPTVRSIASTGVVSTLATALKLEAGTDGALPASESLRPSARDGTFSREPGLSIMRTALRDGVDVSVVLNRLGISHQDLWAYVNHRGGEPGPLRRRVRAALEHAGLPASGKASS